MSVSEDEMNRQAAYAAQVRELLAVRCEGRTPKALTHTYGCQGNVSDGEHIDGILSEVGYDFTDDLAEADLILYNTCAVREHAEDRVFGNVGRLKKYKESNPNLVIGLCGCMVQQPHILKRIQEHFHYVDLAFGTHVIYKIPELLYRRFTGEPRVFDISEISNDIAENGLIRHDSTLKAFLPVTYGCNNFCSYCVVPYVRGRERSRSYDDILDEAQSLVAQGYKEIMLLGQNVNSYGNDFHERGLFPKLLWDINGIPGDFRIRFMTSHPKDCSHELLDAMAECEKVERHLHLPVQSGNDRVLKAMNRHYDRARYLSLIQYARSVMPDLSITSDIIVGFPGETHEEFEDTISLVREVGYSALYTFIYSPRVGTPAATLPDPVSREEKQKWFEELQAAQEETASARTAGMTGQTVRVLAEGRSKHGKMQGRTSGNTMVEFEAPDEVLGTFCNVTITEPLTFVLKGELQR